MVSVVTPISTMEAKRATLSNLRAYIDCFLQLRDLRDFFNYFGLINFFLSKFERFWVDRFFSLSLRDFLNYVFRDSINKSLNRVFRELFHFATCAICNMWNLEQVQFGTHAICNTCKL